MSAGGKIKRTRALNVAAQVLVLMSMTLLPRAVSACSVCFGDSDSPQARGASMAILFLLGITCGVLGGMATFFMYLIRRAKRFSSTASGAQSGADG